MDKEELEFVSASFEEQQERLREFGNETRGITVDVYNKVEALEAYIKELVEAIQNNKTPPPPSYGPPPKTKEECEAKGGKWEDGKCVMPPKKEGESLSGLGVLPSSRGTSDDEAKANAFSKKILGGE